MVQKRLGKGLDALIREEEIATEDTKKKKFFEIEVELIKPNPYQPRLEIDKTSLNDLKNSIKEKGILQPVVLRKADGAFELIAGERRLIAAKELGFKRIPAIILSVTSKEDMLELSIIENVQRENLNPIEIANGYKRLIDECDLTQEEVSTKVGVERSTVTNLLRLLKLPETIKKGIMSGKVTAGHARALLSLNTDDERIQLYNRIIRDGLSVRNIEEIVARKKVKKTPKTKKISPFVEIEDKLREILGTKVKVKEKKEGGIIEIDFYSPEDLERLIEMFEAITKNY